MLGVLNGRRPRQWVGVERLQRAAEGLVQQGLFKFVQCGEFALVEGFEALGFAVYESKLLDNAALLGN